jgi:hypothetical protein
MSSNVKVTKEHIEKVMAETQFEAHHLNGKTTIVMATLPNGFVIVESSSCVDPANYDPVLGESLCIKRIEDQVWKLEGYVLQSKVAGLL